MEIVLVGVPKVTKGRAVLSNRTRGQGPIFPALRPTNEDKYNMHRPTSEYHITCDACNAPIVSVTREAKCEKCGVSVRVDWPVRSPYLKTL